MQKLFGTDGVRGRVGDEPVTPETVLKLGWAAGCVLGGGADAKVLIGKDTRVSGYLLESALEAGFSAAGVNISLLGPMPTPGIAYLTRTARARAGIVISASHNHYQDNGIKFFSREGSKLPDAVEHEIERKMAAPLRTVSSSKLGKAERFPDAAGRYIEFCKSAVANTVTLNGVKIVVDCANGAAYHIAPSVFSELGAEVESVADRPDGFNINHECGSTNTRYLRKTVVERHADIGVALDGDGDRVILIDHTGQIVDGDQILHILATNRKRNGRLEGGVVGTLMSNLGLEQALAAEKIPFRRANVGDRHVVSMLRRENWVLGGEPSGHIICLDKSTTGDGIVAALQVLAAMVETQSDLYTLKQGMREYPQIIVNVRLPTRLQPGQFDVARSGAVAAAVREAELELAKCGRVVLRASGTEPVVRVMVEGEDPDLVRRISRRVADIVEQSALAEGVAAAVNG